VSGVEAGVLAALAPLGLLALAAVAAMLAAPLERPGLSRGLAAAGVLAAGIAAAAELGAAPVTAGALLRFDLAARLGVVFAAFGALPALALLDGRARGEAAALAALTALGAASLAAASHAASLLLAFELSSLSLVGLVAFRADRAEALEAGYKLVIPAAAAAAFLTLGLALVYARTGSLALADWAGAAEGGGAARAGFAGMALLLAAFAFKLALPPFHFWLPDAFEAAPPAAAAMAGAVAKGGALIALLRLIEAGAMPPLLAEGALAALAAAAILLGAATALRQEGLMRMLGWSGVAQSGFVAAAASSGAPGAAWSALFYLGAYAFGLMAALAAAAAFEPGVSRAGLAGLLRERPWTAAALVAGLVSIAGLPASAGFSAKLTMFWTLAASGGWALFAAAAAGSLLGLFVYGRFAAAAMQAAGGAGCAARAPGAGGRALAAALAAALLLGTAAPLLAPGLPASPFGGP